MALIPIEISGHHVHLTDQDWTALFGSSPMTSERAISQVPQFVATQRVSLRGPKGVFEHVAIVGPARRYTQVELSMTDARSLGLTPPLADSGSLEHAATITLVGTQGEVVRQAAIIQQRHVHLRSAEATALGLHDHQLISMRIVSPRGAVLNNVLVRIHPKFSATLHLDTDEGNACGVVPGMTAEIVP